jgi:hypothetical protein
MADTTNYGWTKPTEGGSTGVWDTILNEALDDIDAQMKIVADAAGVAGAAGVGDFLIAGVAGIDAWPDGVPANTWAFSAGGRSTSEALPRDLYFRLPSLPVGHEIDAIRSYGHATAGPTMTVALIRIAQDGTITVVNAGHTLPTSAAETETTGIAHTILAETDYYIRLQRSGSTNTFTSLRSVGYTIVAA